MPGLVGGFGNYLLPIHCGSPDMAKLNLGSIYYKIGAVSLVFFRWACPAI
jgi:heme/copper-type cytochrome/quinol oxidase subunit 1